MSVLWVVVAFLSGLALGVLLVTLLVQRYVTEIQGLLAELFDQVRYRMREAEREDES